MMTGTCGNTSRACDSQILAFYPSEKMPPHHENYRSSPLWRFPFSPVLKFIRLCYWLQNLVKWSFESIVVSNRLSQMRNLGIFIPDVILFKLFSSTFLHFLVVLSSVNIALVSVIKKGKILKHTYNLCAYRKKETNTTTTTTFFLFIKGKNYSFWEIRSFINMALTSVMAHNLNAVIRIIGIVAPLITNIPLMKGAAPKRLNICYDFGTSIINIQNVYLL